MKILDLGCGNKKHEIRGAKIVGVDVNPKSAGDVVHDLNKIPWPFEDNEFDEVICQDILEHLEDIPAVMTEIYRVSKKGGKIRIRTPHYSSHYAYNDPTHVHFFGYQAFDGFCRDGKFRMVETRLLFPRIWRMLGLSAIINHYPRRWEQLVAFIIRAENMYIELEVAKK